MINRIFHPFIAAVRVALHPSSRTQSIRLKWIAPLLIAGGCILFAGIQPSSACPLCVDSVADTGAGGATDAGIAPASTISQGYNYSIYFMIAMMYAVLGATGGAFWYACRNYAPPQHLLMGEPAPAQATESSTPQTLETPEADASRQPA